MLVRALLALAVAGGGTLLLFGGGEERPPRPAAAQPPVHPVLTLDEPVAGTLYFAARIPVPNATVAKEESVYRFGPGDDRPVRVLPRNPRTWHVSAWGDNVVINTEGPGFGDPVGAVDLATGRMLASDAHLPEAGPGGRVAYTGYVKGRSVSAAFVRWSARGRFRPVMRKGIWGTDFLPDGRLVVSQRRNRRAWLSVVSESGTVESAFRVPGDPNRGVHITANGLIGHGGVPGRLRVYTPRGRLVANLDLDGWFASGTRGRRFLLVEDGGDRIASLSLDGELKVIGRAAPEYEVFNLEWEPG